MSGLCAKLHLTPEQVTWDLYGPQALQYSHALLYAADVWTVAPAATVKKQVAALKAAGDTDLLAL